MFLTIPSSTVFADLDDFSDAIKSAEGSGSSSSGESSGSSGGLGEFLIEFFSRIFAIIWYYDNTYLYYNNFPYDNGSYLERPVVHEDGAVQDNGKYYWFSTSLSGFQLQGMGTGAWFSFSGHFYKFFGPYMDGYVLWDENTFLSGFRLGMQFSLIQSKVFNLATFVQWQGWRGVLYRNGAVFGLESRIYPFKPITLRAKAGFQVFDNVSLGEMEFEAGLMLKAWEVFGGYRWWNLFDGEGRNKWQGIYAGIRYYF
ncbi:hypothetical protein FACS1894164_08480 [Spirochaetia bacterium]|nr:hypothetical protein FACS1894164_08480 [Spirochaetia bacterium]